MTGQLALFASLTHFVILFDMPLHPSRLSPLSRPLLPPLVVFSFPPSVPVSSPTLTPSPGENEQLASQANNNDTFLSRGFLYFDPSSHTLALFTFPFPPSLPLLPLVLLSVDSQTRDSKNQNLALSSSFPYTIVFASISVPLPFLSKAISSADGRGKAEHGFGV
ncbi:hypothetical protein FB446DRAFT_792797 [Lentinula raphanica]|nr:hypothetical protein FB446DRAFT_792797 [Lentinula raphanica]